MKAFKIISFAIWSLSATAIAQFVNDGATNTLSNVTNPITGDVTVGTNGAFTLLVLSNNTLLTNSGSGVISFNAAAKSNEVRLVSVTARWLMNGTMYVGSNGASATLAISNGALVANGVGYVGFFNATSNNTAVVSGPGSTWSNRLQLSVGQSGRGNQLMVSDGGQVWASDGRVGSLGSNNQALVTGPGSHWTNQTDFYVGVGGEANRLVLDNGGRLSDGNGYVGANATSRTNEVVVSGAGSLWSNRLDLQVGQNGAFNRLVVSNGGWVVNTNGTVGVNTLATNNEVDVTGSGSVWSNRGDLVIGSLGTGNLAISNGAMVLASRLFMGVNSSSTNNSLIVDGGTLCVTNATGSGVLDVRRGRFTFNSGLVEVDQLLVTNTAALFLFAGGTLSAKTITVNNGRILSIGSGSRPATLNLAGNGLHTFSTEFALLYATLSGNGTITAPSFYFDQSSTISPGPSPGPSIGTIAMSHSPSLGGTVALEISKNGAVLTNDQIQVAGGISYDGSLTVTKIGPTALASGDKFKLFTATGYGGSFTTLSLPVLPYGLGWTNKLGLDGSIEVVPSDFTEVVDLPGLEGSAAWGDYDNDGRLDIAEAGYTVLDGQYAASVWRNSEAGFTNAVPYFLTGRPRGLVAWGDYDNDGALDLVMAATILRNTPGAGFPGFAGFTVANTNLQSSPAIWGDYNNDGLLDLLGFEVWRNTGFSFESVGIPGYSPAAWGDYDNDGWLDAVVCDSTGTNHVRLLHNTGNGFTNLATGIPGVPYSFAWGDYDNDGRLDLLVTGTNDSGFFTQVWRNTGNGFTNINAGLPGVFQGTAVPAGVFAVSCAWGDYDNDGRLDILLAGTTNNLDSGAICQIWRNTGNGFTNINAGLPGVYGASCCAWGDYDNDGRLDILVAGGHGASEICQVWRNQTLLSNTPPTAPTGLSVANLGGAVLLSWNAASDAQTPASGLTYNVRIGSSPGACDALSPMSSASGFRRLPAMGNAQKRLFTIFKPAAGKPYYWSVQAVDTAFAGGPFAPEQIFTVNTVFTPTNGIPVPGDLNGDGIVSQSELAAVLANLNGNGIVNQSELELVLSNYFPNSPFLQMTNVAGLGETNVTFALTNSLAGAFSVEYSSNLVNWDFLGPAEPRYLFTDTNAPAIPQRYYRLRWP